ncbi:MotA/TolQ/ExbB proton channel family protein [Neobacillus vireti]|uniref:MotA/TolQ/ExbB proton channel family protein n=1 Tax=Neobacillus vireti TaxID=220686 RepID=UPI002FFEA942
MKKPFLPILMYLPALLLFIYYVSGGVSKLGSNEFIVLAVYIILGTIATFSINSNNFIYAYLRNQDQYLTKDPESNQLASTIWNTYIAKKDKTKAQLSISSFIEMFMSEHQIGENINIVKRMKLIHTYASISILVGVLGTFVGLVFSLSGLKPDNIDSSILEILAGVHTAFFTSIGGILFSIVINLHSKYRNSEQLFLQVILKIENYMQQKDQKTSDYYVVEALGEVKNAVHNTGRAFLDVAHFSKDFKTATDNLIQFNKDFHENTLAVSSMFKDMKAITEMFNQKAALIHDDFTNLFTYFNNQTDLYNGMKESFEQTANEIRTFAGYQSRNMDGIVKNNEKVQKSFETLFANVQKEVQKGFNDMNDFLETTSAQISLIVSQGDLQVDVNKELAESIDKQVKKSHSSFLKQLKELNGQTNEVKDSFGAILKQMETYFTTNQKLTEITEKIEKLIGANGETYKNQTKVLTQAIQQYAKGSDNALQKSLGELTDLLRGTNELIGKLNPSDFPTAQKDLLVKS